MATPAPYLVQRKKTSIESPNYKILRKDYNLLEALLYETRLYGAIVKGDFQSARDNFDGKSWLTMILDQATSL